MKYIGWAIALPVWLVTWPFSALHQWTGQVLGVEEI